MSSRPASGRRRVRIASEPAGDDLLVTHSPLRPLPSLLVAAILVALFAGAGLMMQSALAPHPVAALASCHPGPEVAPHRYAAPPPMCINVNRTYMATITTTKGPFGILIQPHASPVTANNFVVLALSGYYNGQSFFRVLPWVVQTGDPLGNGRGGPGYTLPNESNGTGSTIFPANAVGMARTPGGAVNGSQFVILKTAWPAPGPDGTYNQFGTVIAGNQVPGTLTASDRIISITVAPS